MRLNEEEHRVMLRALPLLIIRKPSCATEERQQCVAKQLLRRPFADPGYFEDDD